MKQHKILLCRVYYPTLTSMHKWTPLFSQRETPWNTVWQQQNKDWPPFRSSEEMQQQVWLLSLRDVMKDIKPSLDTQAYSIRATLFTWHFRTLIIYFPIVLFFFTLGIIPIGPANNIFVLFHIYIFVLLYLLDGTRTAIGQFSGPYFTVRPAKSNLNLI